MKQEQKTKLCIAIAMAAVICITLLAVLGTRNPKEQENRPDTSMSRGEGEITDGEVAKLPEAPEKIEIPKDSPLGKAKAENPDAVAWLQIPNTEINNVVMQTSNNEYYLFRDETGQKSPW
ncbi:MAG: hypothetical protein RR728_08090, partial [Oscillospiraceae bacterium]